MKFHFHANFYIHGLAIFHGWLETPLSYGFESLRVKSVPQSADHANVLRVTGRIHDEP